MGNFINKLKNGVRYDDLFEDEISLMMKLKKAGIVFESKISEWDSIYRLCNNVNLKRNGEEYLFEVYPNRYMGIFFDFDDCFECAADKNPPSEYCLTYSLNPTESDIKDFDLGNEVKVKVIAKDANFDNEALLVKLPASEEKFFKLQLPVITIGLSNRGKGKNSCKLDFVDEIKGKFIEGRKGIHINGKTYFNIKDVKDLYDVYRLTKKDGHYQFNKCDSVKIVKR